MIILTGESETLERLKAVGVAVLEFQGASESEWMQSVLRTMHPRADQIKVFLDLPLWRDVTVDLNRPPERSEGVGRSPLHMDFVNAEFPPDFVCLLCIRSDPLGGGDSTYAPVDWAVGMVSNADRKVLQRAVFEDGKVNRLENVGGDVNPFAVLSFGSRFEVRFTEQLLSGPLSLEEVAALRTFSDILNAHTQTSKLHPGHAILFDQRRWVHGKTPLGAGQEQLAPTDRRLLKHAFFRTRAP